MSEIPDISAKLSDGDRVIRYHMQTKHHFHRYARSLGYLDWASQPDPFRRFEGAPLIALPLLKPDEVPQSPAYDAIYQQGAVACQPVSMHSLSRFLELSLALSAWKTSGGEKWALRSNPSSGNLHPTEGYLVLPQRDGLDLQPGLYHYAPKEHGLEWRAAFLAEVLARLLSPFPPSAFLFGLASIHWREAWKYGERAFRYCNHDVGHAIGAARIASASLGWNMVLLDGVEQDTIALLLGTHRADDFAAVEPEHPDCLAVIWPIDAAKGEESGAENSQKEIPLFLDAALVKVLANAPWYGKANRLSGEHEVHWDAIDAVAAASWKSGVDEQTLLLTPSVNVKSEACHVPPSIPRPISASQIIRQRRSAVSFDGQTWISAATFYRLLQRLVPCAERVPLARPVPWDVWPYDPAIHLVIFVHRVEGLTPGMYILIRDRAKLPLVQQSLNQAFVWTQSPGCPENLACYQLMAGDMRSIAAQLSCHQAIAADSAFSLGMLAEFDGRLRQAGAWFYPRLFWEAGLLGQVLYLEAEAAGVRGTGIGCFFDDPMHDMLGIQGMPLQSLYHFTIGGAVEDLRLMTLSAYHHLNR
jgi:SagB-type dehydrogenase family enzyme